MSAVEAFARLKSLRQSVFRTGDAAACLRVPESTAHDTLKRLEAAGLVLRLRQGLWSTDPAPDPMAIVDRVVSPHPAYVSFESALFYHGMIQQIPPRVTVASLDRARTIKTRIGTYVVRHVPPHLFGGYDDRGKARIATPEKALFDTAYRAAHRGWRSAYFPEIEIPATFDPAGVDNWIARIPSAKLRTMTQSIIVGLGVDG